MGSKEQQDHSVPPAERGNGYVLVGRVGKPWGNRGEVYLVPETDFPDRFQELDEVLLEIPRGEMGRERVRLQLEGVRRIKERLIAKFSGHNRINEAEALRGSLVLIAEQNAVELEEGEYFHHQLMGLSVVTESGRRLGEVIGILRTAGGDILEVAEKSAQNECATSADNPYLIPAVEEICYDVNLSGKVIRIRPPDGLLELNRE